MSGATMSPEMIAKIETIDLRNCRNRLMDPKSGKGWSAEKADAAVAKYRRFLQLVSTGIPVVPTREVDEVWHTHILDTRNYAADCQRVFGYFVHHRPYMDEKELKTNWSNTNAAYEAQFGEKYSKAVAK